MIRILILASVVALTSHAYGDQGILTNAGGVMLVDPSITLTSPTIKPAGSLTLACPLLTAATCTGGSYKYKSNDGTTTINATFTSGTLTDSCSGGGKGGALTCTYNFMGYLSGSLVLSGVTQAIIGLTDQTFQSGGTVTLGTTTYVSAYTPFFYTDGQQIYRSDDMQGTNQISYGTQGSGVGQFNGASGIALDLAGRIYIADAYNCRIIRMDDMKGTNWTAYGGTCGSVQGQFLNPAGIALDATGRIYVMDAGNSRVVRIDDMSGTNFVSYGSLGTGPGQFSAFLVSVAVDGSGHIYIPDTGNLRLVRIDDMQGTNWTTLTQSPPQNGVVSSLQSPTAVAFDSSGRIYVTDNESYQPAVVRIDDMTGANWTTVIIGPGGLNSIAVDSGGTIFLGGGGAKLLVSLVWVVPSSGTIAPLGPNTVRGITITPSMVSSPALLTILPTTLTFADQIVGTSSLSQQITVTNTGGSSLQLSSIGVSSSFTDTTTCSPSLGAGLSCIVSVSFVPVSAGKVNGFLTLLDNSGNLGSTQSITLTGLGTVVPIPPALTTTTLFAPMAPLIVGSSVSLAATVAASSGTPTGSITFLDGTTILGTGMLSASGTATYVTSSLAVGAHSLTAQYPGVVNFAPSVSTAAQVTIIGLPDYSVSITPSSLTITHGSTGTATFTVTPINGYAGVITFGCGAMPTNASCSFAASQLTFTSGIQSSQSTTLTIDTQSHTTARNHLPEEKSLSRLALALGVPISMLPILILRRRLLNTTRILLTLLLCSAGLALAAVSICGCSSGAVTAPVVAATLTTAAGTYTVPIIITAGTNVHSISFSLTIN